MKLLFIVSLDSLSLPMFAMNLRDADPDGRVGKIVDMALCRQRPALLGYFARFD